MHFRFSKAIPYPPFPPSINSHFKKDLEPPLLIKMLLMKDTNLLDRDTLYSQKMSVVFSRAGESDNFFAAPAPDFYQVALASDIFLKWLRLLVFFSSGSSSKGPKT